MARFSKIKNFVIQYICPVRNGGNQIQIEISGVGIKERDKNGFVAEGY